MQPVQRLRKLKTDDGHIAGREPAMFSNMGVERFACANLLDNIRPNSSRWIDIRAVENFHDAGQIFAGKRLDVLNKPFGLVGIDEGFDNHLGFGRSRFAGKNHSRRTDTQDLEQLVFAQRKRNEEARGILDRGLKVSQRCRPIVAHQRNDKH